MIWIVPVLVYHTLVPAGDAAAPSGYYFPTTVGTKWVMRKYYPGGTHSDVTYNVTSVEEKDGAKIVAVHRSSLEKSGLVLVGREPEEYVFEWSDKYRVLADRIYHIATTDLKDKKWQTIDPPRGGLKLPGKPGDKWTNEIPAENFKMTCTVGKPERVKVVAGTFEAIPIYVETTQDGKAMPSCTCWSAPGIGGIKSIEDGKVVMELVSFTPGKKGK